MEFKLRGLDLVKTVIYDEWMWREVHVHTRTYSVCTCIIKKYSSTCTSYVGMGYMYVQNGHLYLRYESSFVITIAKCSETVADKKHWLYYCKKFPRSSGTADKS